MGLENLKSVFSNIKPFNKKSLLEHNLPHVQKMKNISGMGEIATASDYTPHTNNDMVNISFPMITQDSSIIRSNSEFPILDTMQLFSIYKSDSKESLYQTYNYDPRIIKPRTSISKNAYTGTRMDRVGLVGGESIGIGGLFNSSADKYSTVFLTINTPSINDIVDGGNLVTNGGGYPNKKAVLGMFDLYKTIRQEAYVSPGADSLGSTWYQNGGSSLVGLYMGDTYPNYNPLTRGLTMNGDAGGGHETRTVGLGGKKLVAKELGKGQLQFSTLYTAGHESTGKGYHYSKYVSRDKLKLETNYSGNGFDRGKEPYIVSKILNDGDKRDSFLGRTWPGLSRLTKDGKRLGKFMLSKAGLWFIARQNLLGLMGNRVTYVNMYGDLMRGRQRFKEFYDPTGTLVSAIGLRVGAQPNFAIYRNDLILNLKDPTTYEETVTQTPSGYKPPEDGNIYARSFHKLNDSFTKGGIMYDPLDEHSIKSFLGLKDTKEKHGHRKSGDKHTLFPMITSDPIKQTLGAFEKAVEDIGNTFPTKNQDLEAEKNGMPMYFHDLRDNTLITFRAYITGLTETISPMWTPQYFIGRSEPAYTYERGERQLDFTLQLFAHTPAELDAIYQKMNRLTSLCYPEYKKDISFSDVYYVKGEKDPLATMRPIVVQSTPAKLRMKPPMTKFRLGELYGNKNRGVTGFIKALTYIFPEDSGVWETQQGKRVPKYIEATFSFQVIHGSLPSLQYSKNTGFFGIDTVTEGTADIRTQ